MNRFQNLYVMCFVLLSLTLTAADTLDVVRGLNIPLIPGKSYAYFVDKDGTLSLNDVMQSEFRTEVSEADFAVVDEAKTVWVRIVLRNRFDYAIGYYLYWDPTGVMYVQGPSGQYNEIRTGRFVKFSERNVKSLEPLLEIVVPGSSIQTVYLRIDQRPEIYARFSNLDEATLYESSAWVKEASDMNWEFGIFFGILSFIVIYNLLFYITLRDKSYLHYVLTIACILLVWANGSNHTFRFLFPESDHGLSITIYVNFFALMGLCFVYTFFTASYLRTRELVPRLHKILVAFRWISGCLLLLLIGSLLFWKMFLPYSIVKLYGLILVAYTVVVAVAVYRKRYSPALYFILGNGVYFVSLFFAIFHVFPPLVFGHLGWFQFGTLAQVCLFSLGLAKRINVIRDDREKAQEEIIGQLKINEELKTQVTRELEQKVSERTIELSEQKKIVEEKNKDILDSITYAKRLQQAILPSEEIWKSALKDSFIFYQPKDIVAGDFYWLEKRGNLVFVAAADCTGHGVPGAMVSVVCSNAMNRAFKEFSIDDPGKLLDKVRELVVDTFAKSSDQVKDGMDISLARIDLTTREVLWAGANNPLWYFSNGAVNEIKANKQPIGIADSLLPFTTHKIILNAGDLIYLFTDGFADQFGGPKGKKFKYKPLQELVLSIVNQPMSTQQEILFRTISEWKGNLEQIDDVCIIGIRV